MNPWVTTKGSRVRMLRYPTEGERLGPLVTGRGQRVVCTERTTPTGESIGLFRTHRGRPSFRGSRWLRRIRLSV